jgi:serine/threonine protein kinase
LVVRAIAIAHQIASALAAAHGASIIHRDLKSDNIFLTTEGDKRDHVKVLDFGISRFQTAKDHTAQGSNLLGTPEFMAPEQITTPETIDHRVDIYGLGVILYEMLTGSVPFRLKRHGDLDATHEVLARVVHEPPPPFTCADAPPGFVELVNTKLLAKDPARRFQTMIEVQHALEAFGTVLPTGPVRIRRESPVDPAIAKISDHTVSPSKLSDEDLAREVKALGKRWSLADGQLVLDLYSREMQKLSGAVGAASEIADEMEHYPRVTLRFPHLAIALPDAKTTLDLVFAARLEHWLRENGW